MAVDKCAKERKRRTTNTWSKVGHYIFISFNEQCNILLGSMINALLILAVSIMGKGNSGLIEVTGWIWKIQQFVVML